MDKTLEKEKKIRMMRRHRWNYKHLFLFFISVIVAVLILTSSILRNFISNLGNYSYIGAFITGIFFAFGFTAAPATASFLVLTQNINPIFMGLIGGLGTTLSNYLIFRYIKYSMDTDLKYILKITGITKIKELKKTRLAWIVPFLGAFIIATPLPDEAGDFIFGISNYSTKRFLLYVYLLSSAGIMLIGLIGRV